MDGNSERTENLIKVLSNDCLKDEHPVVNEAVRIVFALMLKLSGSVNDWNIVNDKLKTIWRSANRIRILFGEKASNISDKEELENKYNKLLISIKSKANLLMKFNPSTTTQERRSVIIKKTMNKEQVTPLTRLKNWNDMQLTTLTERQQTISTLIVRILESKITAVQLVDHLQYYHMRAIVLYNIMITLEHLMSGISSNSIQMDVCYWIGNIFNNPLAYHWHYSEYSVACGVILDSTIREAFFGIIKQLLISLKGLKSKKNLIPLLSLLRYDYSIKDHRSIHQYQLLHTLHKGSEKISSLWGKKIYGDLCIPAKYLFDTFEYIVRRIVNNIYESKEVTYNETTKKLLKDIAEVMFGELKRAADNYEGFEGIDSEIASECIESDLKNKEKEKSIENKLKIEFDMKNPYSQKSCSNLLNLLHYVYAVTPIEGDFSQLFRLLEVGSIQHQFIVLQILPLVTKSYYESLIRITDNLKVAKWTNNSLLDLLINLIIERRKGIWVSEINMRAEYYSITKHAISIIRVLVKKNREICDSLGKIVRDVIFGKSIERKNKEFIETLLSIIGGEHVSIYKGAKTVNGFSVAYFKDKNNMTIDSWSFNRNHGEVVLHQVGNEITKNEPSVITVKASKVLPTEEDIDLTILFKGIDKKQIIDLLKKAIINKLPEDSLLASIQVKVIKVMMTYLKQGESVVDKEFVETLLEMALEKPKVNTSKSLPTIEMSIEEMRKIVSQSKNKCLSFSIGSLFSVEIFKNTLQLSFEEAKKLVHVISYKRTKKIRNSLLKAFKFDKEKTTKDRWDGVVFVLKADKEQIVELAKEVKAIIIDTPLEDYKDINIPMIQISAKDMNSLDKYKRKLMETNEYLKNTNFKEIVPKYLNIISKEELEVSNFGLALKSFLSNEVKENKKEETEDPLIILSQNKESFKRILKVDYDEVILREKENLEVVFDSRYRNIYINSEYIKSYLNVLADLKLFLIRRLILQLALVNKEAMKRSIKYFLLMVLEGEYLSYGFEYKELVKEINRVIIAIADEEFLKCFDELLESKVKEYLIEYRKQDVKNLDVFKISKVFEPNAERHAFILFIYKLLHTILKVKPLVVLKYKNIGTIIERLTSLIVIANLHPDRYRCCLLIKEIFHSAHNLQNELTVAEFNNVLSNKGIESISKFTKGILPNSDLITKALNEINMEAYSLYKISISKFGEEAISSCALNNLKYYLAIEIMKAFPNMTPLLNYVWLRICSKSSKSATPLRLETLGSLYFTKYCLLAEVNNAEAIDLNVKNNAIAEIKLSSDKTFNSILERINDKETTLNINFNRIYITFQIEQASCYGFGSNEGGRLGVGSIETVKSPVEIKEVGCGRVSKVYSADSHTILIKENGQILVTGKGQGMLGKASTTFAQYKKEGMTEVMDTSKRLTIYYNTNSRDIRLIGDNLAGKVPGSAGICIDQVSGSNLDEIAQISFSSTHTLLLGKNGNLYDTSTISVQGEFNEEDLFGAMFGEEVVKYQKVETKLIIKKILALESVTILLCKNSTTNKNELYSKGIACPVLGQGNSTSNTFTLLSYPEDIEFVEVVGYETMAAAITSKGELYVWGKSTNHALGLYNEGKEVNEVNVPTKVGIPSEQKVINVSIGTSHMLVLVEDIATRKRIVLGFGDNTSHQLGVEDKKATKSELNLFEFLSPYLVIAGDKCSFVFSGNYVEENKDMEVMCEVHKTKPENILFLSKTKDGFKFYCHNCVHTLPNITMAVRNPIKGIGGKRWPLLDSLQTKKPDKEAACKQCKLKLDKEPIYLSAVKEVQEILCESCYFKIPSIITPCIYYRIATHKLFDTMVFPIFSLVDFYNPHEGSISMTVVPKYKLTVPKEIQGEGGEPTLEDFLIESKAFTKEDDLAIIELLNKTGKDYTDFSLKKDISLEFESKFSSSKLSKDALKRRAKVFIKLNKLIKFILTSFTFCNKPFTNNDIYRYYENVKDYILKELKKQINKDKLSSRSNSTSKTFDLHTELPIILKALNVTDYTAEYTIFGQLKRSLLNENIYYDGKNLPFNIRLLDKDKKSDSSFPKMFETMSKELESTLLPLLVLTVNSKNLYGDNRCTFTLNPSANKAIHMEMFEYFGRLLAICFRFDKVIPLNLASTFWKCLVDERVTREDLRASDLYCAQCLDALESEELDKESFEKAVDCYFVTRLSDGKEVELKENGKKIKVCFENRREYAQLIEKARLEEAKEQVKAVKRGFFKLIPQYVLKLYSIKELEDRICKISCFNISKLKEITKYKKCNARDNYVQYFWTVLEQLAKEKPILCTRFLCGKTKLPKENAKFIIDTRNYANPDMELPNIDRCYLSKGNYNSFKLTLPKYTTLEVTKKKLLEALSSFDLLSEDANEIFIFEEF